MKTRSIGLLTIAHASADINQGAVPVLLPFFIAAHHLSYTAAAAIVFSLNAVSTAAQPLFGYLSDRKARPWLIPFSVLIIGLGVSATGFISSYGIGLAAVMVSGLGTAIFHPEGTKLTNHLAGDQKATAMSYFAIGGQLGFAVGPLMASAALFAWGMKGTGCLIIPPAIMAAVLVYMLPRLTEGYDTKPIASGRRTGAESKDLWFPFVCLALALLVRSVTFYGLNTFLPLFWINVLHQPKGHAGTVLAVFLASMIAGNFLGGRSADRLGLRTVTITGFLLVACLLPLLLVTSNPLVLTLLFVPIGILLSLPFSAMVVLGLSYLPSRVGLASGITLGLAYSFGGLATPALGWIADRNGLRATIEVIAFLPIASLALTCMLPKEKRKEPVFQTGTIGNN